MSLLVSKVMLQACFEMLSVSKVLFGQKKCVNFEWQGQ